MTEEQEIKLKQEIANRLYSNLSFQEAQKMIIAIAENEAEKIFSNMSDEEKEEISKDFFKN